MASHLVLSLEPWLDIEHQVEQRLNEKALVLCDVVQDAINLVECKLRAELSEGLVGNESNPGFV